MKLSDEQKRALINLAKDAILAVFERRAPQLPDDEAFREKRGLFVTLNLKGELRGCIGYIQPYKTIAQSVAEMAVAAAFEDYRFPPLRREELDEIEIEISLLSPLVELKSIDEIQVGRDGLFLQHPYGSGLLLPQVATEYNWDRDTFLEHLCAKAGVRRGAHKDKGAKLFSFQAQVFG
ncbi:MAG: AmmeMemoRadiSam system protein A [Candidatus Cloacimonadaceae bacterium]